MDAVAQLCPAAADSALARAAAAGDMGAFRALVDLHHMRIYRFLLRHAVSPAEAEELTQETFLQAYLGLGRFRNEARWSTWLTGIALNLVRNHVNRSPGRRLETALDEEAGERCAGADGTTNPEQQAAQKQALRAVAAGLAALTPEAREGLMLVVLEGLSYDEAAALLGEPVGSLKSRVCRARRQLRAGIDSAHLDWLTRADR